MESLRRPAHRRKLSNANGVFSFSSKNAYDDVFAAPPPTAAAVAAAATKFKAPAGVKDYGEIFGGGSRGSSIPVLDLSALDERSGSEDHRSCSKKLDYAKIFGGYGDEVIAVPYEELFAEKGRKCSSDKAAMNQSDKESPLRGSDNCSLSGKNKGHSSEASDQSLDGVKQVNMSYHKSSQRSKDGTNGTTHVAKLQAVPGFTYFVDETARQQKTPGDRPVPSIKSEVQRTWSFSGNIHEENNGRKTEMPLPIKLNSEGVDKVKRGSWLDGSRSNDKLFNSGEINLKSHSFKSSPSSSPSAKLNDSKGHPKRSKSSNFASKANASQKAGDYLSGSSDEELDMNSAAAASAAALRKAIEQAQESIRLAKELMERKKDGFQGYSKPSSKGRDRKESKVDREANNSQENNAKETHEKFDNVLQGFTGRNRKTTLRTDEVATTFERCETLSPSREVEVEKQQKNVVKIHGDTTSFSDLGNNGDHRTATSASGQIENKNSIIDKQARDFDEMKTSEETTECIENHVEKTKAIEQDFPLGNAENRTNVHWEAQEPEETVNKLDSVPMLHEYGVNKDLKITQEDIVTEEIRNGFDEWEECENNFQECLDIVKEEKLEPPRLEDDYMPKESQKLVEEEKEPHETFQRKDMEMEPADVHYKEKENDNGLGNSCNGGGGMMQEEACQFVEKDDKPIEFLDSCSYDKAHEETEEGKDSKRSDPIQGRDIEEIVAIHAHYGEETQRVSEETLKEEEVEELDLNDMEPIDAHDGEKSKKILMEEHEEEEVQRRPEETYNYVEANQEIPEEELEWEEVEKRIKEPYVNEATESLWIEADKSTENQKAEVMQEAEEAESVHLEAVNCDNNQEIGFLEKAACKWNSDTAFGTFSKDATREVQEAGRFEVSNENEKTSQDAVENHEDSCSTPAANEAFYQCEKDADEADEAVKEASKLEEREISETSHFVQSVYQEHVTPSDMQSDFKAVDSNGNGANVHCNEIDHAHTLSKENAFETADLVQNAVKENDINIKMQDAFEAHLSDEKAAYTGSSEDSRQKGIEENVEEGLSFNPEIGGGLVHNSGENAENVKEAEVAFDKEVKKDDVKVVNKERNVEEDSKEAKSIPLASQSTKIETYKEMKTVQNMQHAEEYLSKTGAMEGKEMRETKQKGVKEKDDSRKIEANKRERERNIDRIAVERAIREARERAFAEARERAERAAVERANAEVRQRVIAEAREKLEKATAGSRLADKASIEAKLKAERAAVERATAEARERALEKALSQKSTAELRLQAEKLSGASRDNGLKHSFSSSDLETLDGNSSESAQRRKARLERHQRIMERAAKALEEKNMRDLIAQKEQAERNRLAESLDADIKRWASGKEGNLRALLSTLQYILGPDSGWQPISLTEIITTVAVKKAYRKATLSVHPDKLQQRGASIQQKYICEKVFDLLKAAWNRFNSEER